MPPPLGRCFPPYPPLKPPGPRPSLTSWSGFGRRRKEGPWSPPQLSSAALPDWLCVPGAQLQSLQTPSETQGIRSAATQRGVAGWPQIPGLTSRGSLGGGARTGRPPQPPRGPASRVLRPRLLSAPPPFPSLPAAASLLLRPPTPPATSPRFLIPATSALGGSLRGRRQPRGASRTDAAGAARSRRRLVNGTRTGAGADTAALALRQGPTARIPRPPSGAPGEARRQCPPLAWMGLLWGWVRGGWSLDENVWRAGWGGEGLTRQGFTNAKRTGEGGGKRRFV